MMGSFLTRALMMVLGYAYPAYECYKTVELNRPEIEQLRFWCQYWILVALLTVFERVADAFISWLPMYSEAKLAFFVYLWYPKTRGTTYVYETFFRPYISKHETDIDRNLIELRTRAGDMVALYWQKAASYGQTRFFEILQYVASQSQSQPSRSRPAQQPQNQAAPTIPSGQLVAPARQPANAARQPPPSQQVQQLAVPTSLCPDMSKQHLLEPKGAPAAAHPQSSSSSNPPKSEAADPAVSSEVAIKVEVPSSEAANSKPQEVHMEDGTRITRGRLRKRAAMLGGPPGR